MSMSKKPTCFQKHFPQRFRYRHGARLSGDIARQLHQRGERGVEHSAAADAPRVALQVMYDGHSWERSQEQSGAVVHKGEKKIK